MPLGLGASPCLARGSRSGCRVTRIDAPTAAIRPNNAIDNPGRGFHEGVPGPIIPVLHFATLLAILPPRLDGADWGG
jgi:hypothetical protein